MWHLYGEKNANREQLLKYHLSVKKNKSVWLSARSHASNIDSCFQLLSLRWIIIITIIIMRLNNKPKLLYYLTSIKCGGWFTVEIFVLPPHQPRMDTNYNRRDMISPPVELEWIARSGRRAHRAIDSVIAAMQSHRLKHI